MYSFICPSSYREITIILVGDINTHPTLKDLEQIRSVFVKDRERLKDIQDWCSLPVQVQIIPESPQDKEYVYYCTSDEDHFWPTESDVKHYQEVFEEGLNMEDFILFSYYPLSVQRISRSLLPFL